MASIKKKVRNNNNISEDLAFIILSKLPVKSLNRFRCIVKSWVNLLENPQFKKLYVNNVLPNYDNNNNSCLFLNQTSLYSSIISNPFMLCGDMFKSIVKLEWPTPFQEDHNRICIAGSSFVNGMICLYEKGDTERDPVKKIVFWNPTTNEFKLIPPYPVHCPRGIIISSSTSSGIRAFGYDVVGDDYKVIQNFSFRRKRSSQDGKPIVPKNLWLIYSLRSNSWKEIDNVDHIPTWRISNRVYLNGVCHWGAMGEIPLLVSFNLRDEVFHTTPLLDYDVFSPMDDSGLMVLNHSVAMITIHECMTYYDISILGEVGVKESWTKLLHIGPLPFGTPRPIKIWNNGDMLIINKDKDIEKVDNCELAWFHSSTRLAKDLGVKVRVGSELVS